MVIRPTPPFRLDLTVWALRRRARNVVDRWDGRTYRRVLELGGTPTQLSVRQAGSVDAPRLIVTAAPPPRAQSDRRRLRSIVNRLLGVQVDLRDWYQMAAGDTRLRPLAEAFKGMKPPGFPPMFEAVVNAFACQQLSLDVGIELNVFPADDVGAQKRLGKWLGRSDPLDYAGVSRAVKRWQPFAGVVYLHLLLDGLAQGGALAP